MEAVDRMCNGASNGSSCIIDQYINLAMIFNYLVDQSVTSVKVTHITGIGPCLAAQRLDLIKRFRQLFHPTGNQFLMNGGDGLDLDVGDGDSDSSQTLNAWIVDNTFQDNGNNNLHSNAGYDIGVDPDRFACRDEVGVVVAASKLLYELNSTLVNAKIPAMIGAKNFCI